MNPYIAKSPDEFVFIIRPSAVMDTFDWVLLYPYKDTMKSGAVTTIDATKDDGFEEIFYQIKIAYLKLTDSKNEVSKGA